MAIMIEDATTFGTGYTLEETWKLANQMPITPLYFAEVTGEGDRIFGLYTVGCDRHPCEGECEAPLFPPVREQLWREIKRVVEDTEAHLGWTLSERYIEDELQYRGFERIFTSRGGIAEVDVEEVVTALDGYGPVTYTSTIGKVEKLVNSGPPNNLVEAWVTKSLSPNPQRLMFRKVSDNNPFNWDTGINGYPRIEVNTTTGNTCWVLPIPPRQGTGLDVTDELYIVDCKFSFFDAPDPSGFDCAGDIEPVYPGTLQKIPYFKKEVLDTGEVRYWVYHRSMINPAFLGDQIHLDEGEFYKFIETVEFACFSKKQRLAEVVFNRPQTSSSVCASDDESCYQSKSYACTTIIDKRLGIVDFELVDLVLDEDGNPTFDENGNYITKPKSWDSSMGVPVRVKMWYRTDPYETGINFRAAVENMRKAIAAAVAAGVQITDCGCKTEVGYFAKMQRSPETRIENRFTGTSIIMARYTDSYGTQLWYHALEQAPRMVRPIVL